jgi:hypothetical protein
VTDVEQDTPRTPTAQEIGRRLAEEKAAIALGWVEPCSYVGLGPCLRARDHELPHVTDPAEGVHADPAR